MKIVAIAVLGALLAACGGTASQPAGGASSPSAASPPAASTASGGPKSGAPAAATPAPPQAAVTSFKVAVPFIAPAMLTYWIPETDGYFKKLGIAPQLVHMVSSPVATDTLLSGEVQVMLTAPSPGTIGAASKNSNVVILGAFSNRLDYQLVANVPKAKQLQGAKIAISKIGGEDQYLDIQALQHLGVPTKGLQFVAVGSIPARAAAVKAHEVAATVMTQPFTNELKRAGLYELASLGSLGIPYVGICVYVLKPYLQQHPAVIQAFLKGLIYGNHQIIANHGGLQLLGTQMRIKNQSDLKATYDTNARGLSAQLMPNLTSLQDEIDAARPEVPGMGALKAQHIVDLQPLQQILQSGFVKSLGTAT